MSQTFSLLTYNIQAGIGTQQAHHYVTQAYHQVISTKAKTQNLRNIGRFVGEFDIVCLQEVDLGGRRAGFVDQTEIVRSVSDHEHHVHQENRTVRTISRHGNAILSRFPIRSSEDLKLPGRIGGRGALVAELDMSPVTVIACVHLSLGLNDQMEQLDFLADHLNLSRYDRARKIVCGDFNCRVQSRPVRNFEDRTGMRCLTRAQHKTYPTWSPRAGFDHILTSDPITDANVQVEEAELSDHKAVSAEFRLAKAPMAVAAEEEEEG